MTVIATGSHRMDHHSIAVGLIGCDVYYLSCHCALSARAALFSSLIPPPLLELPSPKHAHSPGQRSMTATPDFAVPRLVVVDDTDPNIRYSPSSAFSLDTKGSLNGVGWGGDVFNQTITGTTVNASLSYTFNGTFVRAMVAAEGEIEWNCSVDGRNIGTVLTQFVDQVTNFIACDSAGTLEGTTGPHTLDVNFYFLPNTSTSGWLDSIQYQPLPSDPLDSVTLRIHNSDPSVRYSNSSEDWIWQGGQANATHSNGASVDFAFNGVCSGSPRDGIKFKQIFSFKDPP
ncbi:hypothetical protein BDP27DRAFT_1044194 [Rhodocollybia butyracea]|uniref:Uncharacterized protein n=1 Tax=Rhodocollybia butyracea TaxID=206335 RepID=A0A9P5Q6T4_9AGAR|nr:hypothetical protein BDP27DRAFT_1044194 [Rhodocollybia butyracea]